MISFIMRGDENFYGCGDKFLFKDEFMAGWVVNFGVEYTIMLEHVDPCKICLGFISKTEIRRLITSIF